MASTSDPITTAREWGIPLTDRTTALAKVRHWRQYVQQDIASPSRPGTYLAGRIAGLTQFMADLTELEAYLEAHTCLPAAGPTPVAIAA